MGTKKFAEMAAVFVLGAVMPGAARAQDVPGIEICTVEKTMERRTSCLQSNVDFLKKSLDKVQVDSRNRQEAANREIIALKETVASLQKTMAEMKADADKTRKPASATPPVSPPASPTGQK